jgi:spermidine synthase
MNRRVLELMARHYGHARAVLGDRRFVYVQSDALSFLSDSKSKFDLVLNDCFDTLAASRSAGQPVHQMMTRRCTDEGVCADVMYRHLLDDDHRTSTRAALEVKRPYALALIFVPECPGALHLLAVWGSQRVVQSASAPRNKIQRRWCAHRRTGLQFYDLITLDSTFMCRPM